MLWTAWLVQLGWVCGDDGFNRLARTKFDGLALDGNVTLAVGRQREAAAAEADDVHEPAAAGRCRRRWRFTSCAPADMMVVLDDLALPCGRIRLRPGGSDGGHNGLKDIAAGPGHRPSTRGCGWGSIPPPQFVPQRDYVLGRFTEQQRQLMKPAVDRAASAILCWIESGIETAMNRFNAEPKSGRRQ